MIIRCVICKEQFEQKTHERRCGCEPIQYGECIRRAKMKSKLDGYFPYMSTIRRQFQSPIYQWYKEFISDQPVHNYQFMNEYGKITRI